MGHPASWGKREVQEFFLLQKYIRGDGLAKDYLGAEEAIIRCHKKVLSLCVSTIRLFEISAVKEPIAVGGTIAG